MKNATSYHKQGGCQAYAVRIVRQCGAADTLKYPAAAACDIVNRRG